MAPVTREKEIAIGSTLNVGITNKVLPSPKKKSQPIQLLHLRARRETVIPDLVFREALAAVLHTIQ
jgi:hypothetical protein